MSNRRFGITLILALASMLAISSCSKGDDEGSQASISIDVPAIYLPAAGASTTVTFTAKGLERFYISGKPAGWSDITIDAATCTITIVAPSDLTADGIATTGSLSISGYMPNNVVKTATAFLGVVGQKDFGNQSANCYLVNTKETRYSFTPHRGVGGEVIQPERVGVIWQTPSTLMQYVNYENGKISFYIGADSEKTNEIKRGNALIGAFDSQGDLVWSWHIWAAPYDPQSDIVTLANGYQMMGRNLGATLHANTNPEECVSSYGLFYQWGRKEPFTASATYRANSGTGASIYDAAGKFLNTTFETSSAAIGTAEYAWAHPTIFITGTTDNQYDWMWTESGNGWIDSNTKGVNDPCPHGWKLAPAKAFEGLVFDGMPTAENENAFGWNLTDGQASTLFMAAGRRTYLDGKIQNVYIPEEDASLSSRVNAAEDAQPWVGFYWTTATTSDRQAKAFYFWFDKKNEQGGTRVGVPHYKANGMSVRCVADNQ